jgi:cytochrome c
MKINGIRLGLTIVFAFFLSGCLGAVSGMPEPRASSPRDIESGRSLIAEYGCGSCHTIPGVPGADGKAAPPLDRFYERSYIAGKLANTKENLALWIHDPQGIEPGTAMPDLGVDSDEALNIAAYLYHQPSLWDWIK